MARIPDRSIRICADRGGTFCDVHASYPDPDNPEERKEIVVKLLSQDPGNYKDAPTEGIRRVLEAVTGKNTTKDQKVPTDKIDYIRLSTTVATNALLERKGHKHALVITKGFKDLLVIGNQSRPKIFDLNIRRPSVLYSEVLEVDERVTLVGYTSDPKAAEHAVQFDKDGKLVRGYRGPGWDGEGEAEGPGEIAMGLSGEAVRILKRPDPQRIMVDLRKLYDEGYRSIAIILVHSYTFPDHEKLVASIARDIGFEHISVSSQLIPMIKMVPRGASTTADAYLTPVLYEYLDGFFRGFDERLRRGGDGNARVEFMGSDGGLFDIDNFSGLKSILSGPAGGVVGHALTSWDEKQKTPIIGIDVGGTSTDVSRFAGRYETVYETTTAGVTIQSPQLDINTVAAGGGSCLAFRNGLFVTGPESAGAIPGPACYRRGGPLAVTDANLMLGRLVVDYFPKIFGDSEKESLDIEASRRLFEKVVKEVNSSHSFEKELSFDEVVYGFIKIANETMCRPIRALTEARGYSTSSHILAVFGGAGGQHACEIAHILGISTVLIHRYSSILSAYGLALADRAFERQEPSSTFYTPENKPSLTERLDRLEREVRVELKRQGFEGSRVHVERMLNMRFDGTDTALMVLPAIADKDEDFLSAFKKTYKEEFGFLLDTKHIIVDDIKVRGIGKTFDSLGPSVFEELRTLKKRPISSSSADKVHSVYFDGVGRVDDTPVFLLDKLEIGDTVQGTAMIIDDTQTIVLIPGSEAVLCRKHLYITLQ
ncbi:5-oxoprolinase [Fomitiporia mediterranea MF3/22]|uniref:5-oxoprolinase n=1 Tax=Fomitiporia mediterranea (strain MF3/22) TaxID=694068 RepID=UPI0004408DF7|nr:5-oxoprolinase [Fomitiporia mediterranea MF3/22]EJD01112.1 5-oxoprolinase [Fomitiporia mediterranea MF3/22]